MNVELVDFQPLPVSMVNYDRKYVYCKYPEDIEEYDYLYNLKESDEVKFDLLIRSGVFIHISQDGWAYLFPIAQRRWSYNYNIDVDEFLELFFYYFSSEVKLDHLLMRFDKGNLIKIRDWCIYILIYKYRNTFVENSSDSIRLIISKIDNLLGMEIVFIE
ncbi:hypothetical protein E5343_07165 [Rodentibacter caecimuris]|uniref:hypothetical protein n=1 Tax=Rodentibacter caecimuris TaxID=1796644 RepID=UPI001094836D|nr:hypothetical protein [Pasteurella caecimuris]MCR1837821.1 hypothetical protein [Pasteurella caecimuris]MCU0108119.1 hypothetical protein [Pasteurella caecimuris]TGY49367.1 hypothetical protein E5343_07165 [Pasteurella caecimuris]